VGYIPLFIDFKGKRIVVFGGGSVGERRARMFAEAGAEVVVASEEFTEGLRRLAGEGRVRLVRLSLPRDLDKARSLIEESVLVVVALGDPEAASLVAEEALKAGRLVNNAVDASKGDVVVPFRATVWGRLHLAATSLGETGIGARRALEEAAAWLESRSDLRGYYEALSEFKRLAKSRVRDPRRRVELYFKVAGDPEFRRLAESGRVGDALKRALEVAGLEG
jgi:precorrin-2 dehydrogenase/sirohydrochlorin ferrochelatase